MAKGRRGAGRGGRTFAQTMRGLARARRGARTPGTRAVLRGGRRARRG